MHRQKIAVDDGLTNYHSFLRDEGYEVVGLNQPGAGDADAVLLSGQDRDFMGITARDTGAFVLDVTGRSPDEVLADLDRHFALRDG
ncbi:MAG: YkuS family protein [Patescibacteria group bacterium]